MSDLRGRANVPALLPPASARMRFNEIAVVISSLACMRRCGGILKPLRTSLVVSFGSKICWQRNASILRRVLFKGRIWKMCLR
jgi:hypothetical protein